MADIEVRFHDLGPMTFINDGSQGRVHRLTHFQLPDCPGGVAFKEYKSSANFVPAGVEAIVHLRSSLGDYDKKQLDAHAVWPLRVVKSSTGAVVGFLMPLIPREFVQIGQSMMVDEHGNPKEIRKEREIQFLFLDPSRAERLGFPQPNLEQRLRICRSFAEGIGFLAEHRVVFGDISAKNALFKVGDQPEENAVIFVDCDAVRVTGTGAGVSQLNSPDWEPPLAERKVLTQATDAFKFGLFIVRALSPGKEASTARDPARLDPIFDGRGRALLRRTLGDVARDRPSMSEWIAYFDSMLIGGKPTGNVHSGSSRMWVPKRTGQGIATGSMAGSGSGSTRQSDETRSIPSNASIGWRRVNGVWKKSN